MSVLWTPHAGPQTVFLASPAREGLYGGALGGGKSDCLIYGAMRQVDLPNYRALMIRKTFRELREIIDRTHEKFPQLGGKWIASEMRWEFPHSGSTFEFGYAETYKDLMQYQGQEYQHIAVDEIGNWGEERMWTFLLTRLRRKDNVIRTMARCSANPGGPGHGWLKKRFLSVCHPDGTLWYDEEGNSRCFVQATIDDNPTLMENDPQYVKYLNTLPERLKQQLRYGRWDTGEGLAFENLRESTHMHRDPPERWWKYFGAFDWGFGHKWAFGLFAQTEDGVVLVDSAMGRKHSPGQIAERVADMIGAYGLTFADLRGTVSGSDVKMRDEARGAWGPSIAEQMLQYGWALINADQSRVAGYMNLLTYCESPLKGRPRFTMRDTAMNRTGMEQLQGLVVDPDYPNDVLKKDVDPDTGEGGDDFYDMLRYGLMSRPVLAKRPNPVIKDPDRQFTPPPKPATGWSGLTLPRVSHPRAAHTRSTIIE